MSVVLSCGHREDDFDRHYNIMTKEWSRENKKAVGYSTVCLSCFRQYEYDDLILRTDEDAIEWLGKDNELS